MATSKKNSAYSTQYKATGYAANRRRKLERLLKQQPNNKQIPAALSDIHYRRKTPKSSAWSASEKKSTALVANWADQPKTYSTDGIQAKCMFSLKARIRYKGAYLYTESKKLMGLDS